jgi:protein TonB
MARPQLKRIWPLAAIVVAHIGVFYALQTGPTRPAPPVAPPREVVATFITPESAPVPVPPPPPPAAPKAVPIVKKAVPPPPAPRVTNTAPSPTAVTTAPAPPTPVAAEPAPPAPSAPPAPPAPPAPAASAAPAPPRTVTSGIEYIQPPQPVFPSAARRMGDEGKVLLRVLVNEKGRPARVEIQTSSGSAHLDEAGRQAVLRAVFKPFIEDGKAVMAYAIVPINFQLNN